MEVSQGYLHLSISRAESQSILMLGNLDPPLFGELLLCLQLMITFYRNSPKTVTILAQAVSYTKIKLIMKNPFLNHIFKNN